MTTCNIGVFCIVEHHNKILLVKKNYDNRNWILPGGAVEIGEGTLAALTREVLEETGQIMSDAEFVAAFFSKDHYSIALCFHASLASVSTLSFNPRELSEVGFFAWDALPEPMSPRHTRWLEFYMDHRTAKPNNLLDFL